MAEEDGKKRIIIRSLDPPIDPEVIDREAESFARELLAIVLNKSRALKQVEAGRSIEEVAKKTGLPEATIRGWIETKRGTDPPK